MASWRQYTFSPRSAVDRRADVNGIGCVAFYLLIGTQVFEGNTIDPPPPSQRLGTPFPAH